MSPRSSLTTKVLPSRMRTRVAAMVSSFVGRRIAAPFDSGMPTGAGKRRWMRTSSRGSPSSTRAPRSVADIALVRPEATSSNAARSDRMTLSASPSAWVTAIAPSSMRTSQ